jgi:hypothetical protein
MPVPQGERENHPNPRRFATETMGCRAQIVVAITETSCPISRRRTAMVKSFNWTLSNKERRDNIETEPGNVSDPNS